MITREQFVVTAVEHGDLRTAQRYFAQESVVAELQRANAFFQARTSPINTLDEGPADPWYFTQPPGDYFAEIGPRSLIFDAAMASDNIELIKWLYSPMHAAPMGATLAALLPFVGELAVERNHIEVVELLVTCTMFTAMLTDDQRQDLLNEMLRGAVERSHVEAMTLLVAHGAQVAAAPNPRRDDLLVSCAATGNAHCVDALGTLGIFIVGENVLCDASLMGNVDAAHQLLKYGVDWGNACYTTTPLHVAAEDDHVELVELFLEQGFADVDITDAEGETALTLAARHCSESDHNDGVATRSSMFILLQHGAKR